VDERNIVIRLLIVDSVRPMREMMSVVLRDELDIRVVDCADSPEQGIAQLSACNVVLVSASLPRGGAREFIRWVHRVRPEVKVLAIDVPDAQTGVQTYLAAGAADYVLDDESVESLLKKVRAAHSGQTSAQLAST
jgi:two-component system invasion response regulator UvrY